MSTSDPRTSAQATRRAVLKMKLPDVVGAKPIPVGPNSAATVSGGSIRLHREKEAVRVIEYHCPCGHIAHITCDYE